MLSIDDEINNLRLEISHAEANLANLEREVRSLQQELSALKSRYDRVMGPLQARLSILRQAISELEVLLIQRLRPDLLTQAWPFAAEYISVEDQFQRAWEQPIEEGIPTASDFNLNLDDDLPAAPPAPDQSLKKCYYRLAQRYHPDRARSPQEHEQRTQLMAQINAAYAAGDALLLAWLADQPGDDPLMAISLEQLQLQLLQTRHADLRRAITQMKRQHYSLMHCDLMKLKIEESLLRSKGRSLLEEMAGTLEDEYSILLQRFYDLRRNQGE